MMKRRRNTKIIKVIETLPNKKKTRTVYQFKKNESNDLIFNKK